MEACSGLIRCINFKGETMTRLTTQSTNVPEAFQSVFRQLALPWRLDDGFFDGMFRPNMGLLDPAFSQPFDTMARRISDAMRLNNGLMHVEVVEKNGAYKVHADLPGVKKEDISVSVDGNVVSIEACTQGSTESNGGKVLFNERHYGQMSRSFTLENEVDEDKATGKYADGVLTLDLPKKPGAPKAEAKQIAID